MKLLHYIQVGTNSHHLLFVHKTDKLKHENMNTDLVKYAYTYFFDEESVAFICTVIYVYGV